MFHEDCYNDYLATLPAGAHRCPACRQWVITESEWIDFGIVGDFDFEAFEVGCVEQLPAEAQDYAQRFQRGVITAAQLRAEAKAVYFYEGIDENGHPIMPENEDARPIPPYNPLTDDPLLTFADVLVGDGRLRLEAALSEPGARGAVWAACAPPDPAGDWWFPVSVALDRMPIGAHGIYRPRLELPTASAQERYIAMCRWILLHAPSELISVSSILVLSAPCGWAPTMRWTISVTGGIR